MVFNFDPPDITLAFERRRYSLGDTISATVTLTPNGSTEIRKASLNLVAEVRRTEVKMGRTMDMGGASTLQGGAPLRTNDYIPMQQSTEQRNSAENCYSTQFLTSESLSRGSVSRHKVDLNIGPRLPRVVQLAKELELDTNSSLSIEQWWLEVQVDVAMGRDSSVRQSIEVDLS